MPKDDKACKPGPDVVPAHVSVTEERFCRDVVAAVIAWKAAGKPHKR
jgi:hypothetical protein